MEPPRPTPSDVDRWVAARLAEQEQLQAHPVSGNVGVPAWAVVALLVIAAAIMAGAALGILTD